MPQSQEFFMMEACICTFLFIGKAYNGKMCLEFIFLGYLKGDKCSYQYVYQLSNHPLL